MGGNDDCKGWKQPLLLTLCINLARESLFLLPVWEKVRDVMALATSEM